MKRSYTLGTQAFENGQECAPLLDKELINMLPYDGKVGSKTPYFKSWMTGWKTARLAASITRSKEARLDD